MIKFSVIVPVYNTEEFLDPCVLSVLDQTYPTFELILVDDGSTDTSGQICDYYADMYPGRIIAVHRDNQGAFYARFYGIEIAQGDVLMFLDADDTLRADALERLAEAFEKYQCDMVLFEAEPCRDYLSSSVILTLEQNVLFSGESKRAVYRKLIETRELNSVCLKAVRRNCVSVPERFATLGRINHGEDLLFSTHLVASASQILFLKQGLYHYRVRQGSVTHSFSSQRFESIKTIHNEIDNYIELWGMPELNAAYNARKVDGCIVTLLSLLHNRHSMTKIECRNQLQSLAKDPYFVTAYQSMDSSHLSASYRILSYCLYHEWDGMLIALAAVKELMSKAKKSSIR